MRSNIKARVVLAALSAAGATTVALNSYAIDCNDASIMNPVYVTGSSAVEPFMQALGASLYPSGTTIVYQKQGSCNGVDAMVKGITISGTAKYYPMVDDAGTPVGVDCTLPSADGGIGGQVVDLGVSDVFAESCPGDTADPTKVGDFWGPNQVMVFVTPKASMQTNISAEAGYFVMGQPETGKTVAPWTDFNKLAIRNNKSGTQTMIAAAIHLDASSFHGRDETSASGVETAIKAAQDTDPMPEKFLGIVSTGEADRDRSFMKVLGFQDFGQKCSFWPDSSLTAFDKKWVRNGTYPIWGPLHLLAKVAAAGGAPTYPLVAKIVGYFDGSVAPPNGPEQLLDVEIATHTIPQCAMSVKRTKELGPYTAVKPADPCGCYFEAKANSAVTPGCVACTTDANCADAGANKTCSHHYCEAK
jgi:hypothetical protein